MRLSCFVAPERSYEELEALLRGAVKSIEGCQFQLSSPRITELLCQAVDRGVRVNLMVGEYDTDGKKLRRQREYIGFLAQRGATILVAPQSSPNLFHARWILVDEDKFLAHTFALTERGAPADGVPAERLGNRDFGIIVSEDNGLQSAAGKLLSKLRASAPGASMPVVVSVPDYDPDPVSATGRAFPTTTIESNDGVTLLFGQHGDQDAYFLPQFDLLESGNSEIMMYMQYFDTTTQHSCRLISILRRLVNAKYRVRVITCRDKKRPQLHCELQSLGIQHRFHFTKLHAKMIITSNAVILQTKDWIPEAVNLWTDCGVIVKNHNAANYFKSVFEFDWRLSA